MSIANNSILCCPRCGILVGEKTSRLVTDSCGHQKCRRCLLADDECLECKQQLDIKKKKIQVGEAEVLPESATISVTKIIPASKNKKGREVVSMPAHIRREQNDTGSGMHYYCTHCCRKFASRSQQYYHLTCGSDDSKKFKCQECNKAFSTSSHFNYHMESHADRTYTCKLCNKSFTNRMVLQKHEKLHNASPLNCSECGKSFRSKESLSAHIRKLHDDQDLPYKCDECEKSFALKSTLKQHTQKHFDKKYSCQYCDKRFQRNYTLKIHIKKHKKTECFICGICFHKFSDSAVLLRHVKLHQDTVKFRCKECDVTIMRKDNMLRHIRTIHPDRSFKNCVVTTSPFNSNPQEGIEIGAHSAGFIGVTEPKTVENSAVIKCIGNVAPMIVPTSHIPTLPTVESNINPVQIDAETCTNELTLTPLSNGPLNVNNACIVVNGNSKKKRVKKKYDPIKMYRKILASDCEDESVNESESEKEEIYNTKAKCPANSDTDVGKTPTLEKRATHSTSNFSEMHWRKNFKYTYQMVKECSHF